MRAIFVSAIATGFLLLTAPATIMDASAQPAVIVDTHETKATVETVDQQKRMVLLRGAEGALLTVHVGPEVRNLPQLRAGDRVLIRHIEAVAARIARPGEPLPESTTSIARAAPGERPSGMVVDHDRMRVTIEDVDIAKNTVAFVGPDRMQRIVAVRQPAMQEFLRTLKVGDEVDVTFTDAVSISVDPAVGGRP